ADPDNHHAWNAKLLYLDPKWHGSDKDMLDFGRECVRLGDWDGRMPSVMLHVRVRLLRRAEQAKVDDEYRRDPDVWADVKSVLDGNLKRDPDSRYWRSLYADWAISCRQWGEAKRMFDNLGENRARVVFFEKATYEKRRKEVEAEAKKQQ